MQRCQSGRSCSLGTAVYRDVPRVRIPVSAPQSTKFEFSDFVFILRDGIQQTFVCQQLLLLEPYWGSRDPVLPCNPPDKYTFAY